MDYQEEILNSLDKSIFYAERAVVLLLPFFVIWLGPAAEARIIAFSLALSSALTIFAHYEVYGMDIRGYWRRLEFLYVTERIAVLLILWSTGGEVGPWAFCFISIFLKMTSAVYFCLPFIDLDRIQEEFHPICIDPLLKARNRVSRWSSCKTVDLLEARLDAWFFGKEVETEEQGEDTSEEEVWIRGQGGEGAENGLQEVEGQDAKGDEETDNCYCEIAGKDWDWDAEEEEEEAEIGLLELNGNMLERGTGENTRNVLHEVEGKLAEQDAEEELGSVLTNEEEEEESEDEEEEEDRCSRLREPREEDVVLSEKEYVMFLRKHGEELSKLKIKLSEELDMMEAEHEKELRIREKFHEIEMHGMERKHKEEICKLDTKCQTERREWETQRQALLKTIAEQEAKNCNSGACNCSWKQFGKKSMEAMRQWKGDWDRFERRYREFCVEFGDYLQLTKEKNAYLEEKLEAQEEEAKKLKVLLEKSEKKRLALQLDKGVLAERLSWATSMCQFYRSCMNQLVSEGDQC
ncbi:hypothetical protein CRG98_000907 [Punica granatum]|nr:hypothetical protein CRG98_000907 [Punica granatum]